MTNALVHVTRATGTEKCPDIFPARSALSFLRQHQDRTSTVETETTASDLQFLLRALSHCHGHGTEMTARTLGLASFVHGLRGFTFLDALLKTDMKHKLRAGVPQSNTCYATTSCSKF